MLRFAPSPVDDMHISELRIALLNYLVAKQRDEQFLVRIDDLDSKRNIEGKDSEIMMILEKFALKHESVYHQTEHLNLHQTLAIRLLQEEKAFICRCLDSSSCQANCQRLSNQEYATLKKSGEPFVIRVKEPQNNIEFIDTIYGKKEYSPTEIGSFTILKEEGKPSPLFATACDDMLSDISTIIRDERYLLNAPKEIYIKHLLGYNKKVEYLHLANPNKKNNPTLKWLFEEGFVPDAILNYLLLLGYHGKFKEEIFTLPDAIEWFDLTALSNLPYEFNIEKLRTINREHLKKIDNKEFSKLFGFADEDIGKLAKLYLNECSTIKELEAKILPIFKPKNFSNRYEKEMRLLSNIILDAPYFEEFDAFITHLSKESGLEGDTLLRPLQPLLTATENGPELREIYPLIKSYLLEVAS